MTFDFITLPPHVADKLGLPRGKSIPLTAQTREALAKEPTVEAIVKGCEEYLAVDPDDEDYRKFLRRYYHHRGATVANEGRLEEAAELFRKARLFDPADPQLHADFARASLELERPEDAIEGWRAAIAAGGKSPEVFDGLARAFAMKGDWASAKGAAEQGRKEFPDALEPLHAMATVLYHSGDKVGVERVLFEALSKAPDDALILEKLGVWFRECGRFEDAAKAIRRAMVLAPAEPRLLYQRGMVEMRGSDHAAAEKTFGELLQARPGDLDARTALAVLFFETSRPAEAEKLFRESIALAPRDYRAHYHLGRLCARDPQRIDEALGHFENMLDLAPRDRQAVHYAYIVASNAGASALAAKADKIMRSLGEAPSAGEAK